MTTFFDAHLENILDMDVSEYNTEEFENLKRWVKIYLQNKIKELQTWETLIKKREEQVRKHEQFLEDKINNIEKN